jgi:thiamine pyrophosphate-dependent acetolactate synthase large subunit-like protein
MLVSEAVAAVLAQFGADTVFGVVGSGNFHVTNALIGRGARFVPARHECGAASMADGWARTTGRPGIVSVHQGPGLTNAMTGITEAAKSRTPLIVLAADVAAGAVRSNFRIDVASLAAAVGAVPGRLHSPDFAVDDTVRAYRTAVLERRTVLLALPLDVQAGDCSPPQAERLAAARPGPPRIRWPGGRPAGERAGLLRRAEADAAAGLAEVIARAERPVLIAGRGARNSGARDDLEQLADACGALLATSAAARGLFRGSPWDLDVSGGFASPLAAELIRGADLVVGWGCSLNMWTMRHGALIAPGTMVAQVDIESDALAGHRYRSGSDRGRRGRGPPIGSHPGKQRWRGQYGRLPVRRPAQADRWEVRWRDVPYSDGARAADRPADAVDRSGRHAAGRADRRDRLRQLHGLSEHVPVRPRRRRLLLHSGLPVDQPQPGLSDRRVHRQARPAAPDRAARCRR